MERGELYRVYKPAGDRKQHRMVAIVSRPTLIASKFGTVICAPVFTDGQGLTTQVEVGPEQGLKHHSWIMCDNLISVRKSDLSDYVGALSAAQISLLNNALKAALDLE